MSIDQQHNSPAGQVSLISRVERIDGHTVMWASGDIDMATASGFTAAVLAAADDSECITIDLGNVAFMDSSGLNAIVRCRSRLAARQVGLQVENPRRPVRRVFEITGLTDLLAG